MKYHKSILSGILVGLTLLGAFAFLGTSAKRAWIKKTVLHLKSFDPETADLKHYTTNYYDPEKEEYGPDTDIPFHMYTKDGEVHVFKDESWMYVVIHTLHDDDDRFEINFGKSSISFNNVGDFALAIDSGGSIYSSEHHFCGGIETQFDLNRNIMQAGNLIQFLQWTGAAWEKIN